MMFDTEFGDAFWYMIFGDDVGDDGGNDVGNDVGNVCW